MANLKFYSPYDSPEDPAVFTPFSLIHFLAGFYAYLVLRWIFRRTNVLLLFLVWVVLHTMYETKDCFFTDTNSLANCIGDTFSAFAGFFVGVSVLYRFDFVTVFIGGLLLWTSATLVNEPS